MALITLVFGLPSFLVSIDFIRFLITGKRIYHRIFNRILEILVLIGLPLFYLIVIDESANDCCSDSATFAPEHKITIYTIIIICILAYFLSTLKKHISSPVIETLINTILLGGIILNIMISIQVKSPFWLFGNLPVVLFFIFELIKNQQKLADYSTSFDPETLNKIEKIAWRILHSKLIFKIPILLILCLPILVLVSGFLLIFGQKPDSVIRVFTDTYKHGFSQLDYLCDNVQCGGHFLCSVAANGHRAIVKPQRAGERKGNPIICNRQLLIANAFEELIEQKTPKTHRFIRQNYNKVGDFIHRYYGIFNSKIIADIVYVLMKPLEWIFLIVLYTFDQNPENRIAQQYLNQTHRRAIKNQEK
ncbi:DUF6688 domain-containing protein [Aquimarina pacifica]|uniref:DUF6688 domain-containing protein n=1 Tax=Aquimarina pacifica TaxID=1296415 RepID=UPI00046FACBE|nr:DUF6688 family protein [Aquimarina pacifica]